MDMGEGRVGVVGSNKGFYCISQMFFAVFFFVSGWLCSHLEVGRLLVMSWGPVGPSKNSYFPVSSQSVERACTRPRASSSLAICWRSSGSPLGSERPVIASQNFPLLCICRRSSGSPLGSEIPVSCHGWLCDPLTPPLDLIYVLLSPPTRSLPKLSFQQRRTIDHTVDLVVGLKEILDTTMLFRLLPPRRMLSRIASRSSGSPRDQKHLS